MLALVALFGAPQNLLAHARLVKSEPAASSVVKPPPRIRLTFSETLMVSMTRVYLINAKGDTLTREAPREDLEDFHVVTLETRMQLAPGTYTVKWAVAARDGHPSHGSFEFTVIPADPPKELGAVSPPDLRGVPGVQPPHEKSDASESMAADNSIGMIVVRWIAFVCTFLVIGAVVFRMYLLRRPVFADGGSFIEIASTNAATLGLVASVGMLVSLILKIVRESADMPDVSTTTMMFASTWGWSLCCAVLASLAAIVGFVRAGSRSGPAALQGWRVATLAALLLVVTPALTGHAIGNDLAWINVPADIIHVAAGSMWLGTLAVIVIVGISAALKAADSSPSARVAQLINAFSPMALTCGATVVATGVVASLIHLPRINALWTTPYGSALYRKLVFVVLLFAVGAWNWRRTKPRLNSGESGLATLRKLALIEVALATVVLALTAILVALAIPG